jgi:hypothetical protein
MHTLGAAAVAPQVPPAKLQDSHGFIVNELFFNDETEMVIL